MRRKRRTPPLRSSKRRPTRHHLLVAEESEENAVEELDMSPDTVTLVAEEDEVSPDSFERYNKKMNAEV